MQKFGEDWKRSVTKSASKCGVTLTLKAVKSGQTITIQSHIQTLKHWIYHIHVLSSQNAIYSTENLVLSLLITSLTYIRRIFHTSENKPWCNPQWVNAHRQSKITSENSCKCNKHNWTTSPCTNLKFVRRKSCHKHLMWSKCPQSESPIDQK